MSEQTNVVELLPSEARAQFESIMLSDMLWDVSWRTRRTDRFSIIDSHSFRGDTRVEFKIPVDDVVAALEQLEEELKDIGLVNEAAAIQQLLEDEEEATTQLPWDAVRLVLPVVWVWGAASERELTLDGERCTSLSRIETASLVAENAAFLITAFGASECDAVNPEVEAETSQLEDFSVLHDIYWCLTATDDVSICGQNMLDGVHADGARANAFANIAEWMELNARARFGDAATAPDIEAVHTLYVLGLNAIRAALSGNAQKRAYRSPQWQPLLSHQAFLHLKLEVDAPDPVPTCDELYQQFYEHCLSQLELIYWARTNRAAADKNTAMLASFVHDSLWQVAWYWPVLVQTSVSLEGQHTASFSSLRFFDKKLGWTRQYNLAPRDAGTYHVELAVPQPELEIKKVRVSFGRRNYLNAALRERFEPHPLGRLFREFRVSARDYFQRSLDSSPTSHEYYQSAVWQPRYAVPEGVARPYSSEANLVVQYRVVEFVYITNLALTLLLVLLSLFLIPLAIADCAGSLAGTGVAYRPVARSLLSVYLGVMVLFTIERHSSPLVSRQMRNFWRGAAAASAVAALTFVVWAWVKFGDVVPILLGGTP